jgi:hypothetical protein
VTARPLTDTNINSAYLAVVTGHALVIESDIRDIDIGDFVGCDPGVT